MGNFIIVLFKNKIKKKIINKFKTYNNAKKFYDKILSESNTVIFNMETENGKYCEYELGFLERGVAHRPYFVRDKYGRQIRVDLEDPNFNLKILNDYKKEELLFDITKSKRITVLTMIKEYLPKVGVKMISKLNNKIIIQNNEKIHLFSLKTEEDSNRLIDTLSEYMINQERIDCILIKDGSKEQKKYMYDLLNKNGYDKSILYRKFTTYKRF